MGAGLLPITVHSPMNARCKDIDQSKPSRTVVLCFFQFSDLFQGSTEKTIADSAVKLITCTNRFGRWREYWRKDGARGGVTMRIARRKEM